MPSSDNMAFLLVQNMLKESDSRLRQAQRGMYDVSGELHHRIMENETLKEDLGLATHTVQNLQMALYQQGLHARRVEEQTMALVGPLVTTAATVIHTEAYHSQSARESIRKVKSRIFDPQLVVCARCEKIFRDPQT
ncbi:hypothetical protein V5O48_018535 [Marasmius crinis-equi]|uniref:Uncharacterized protein n=1 Tax=Marasmius crinis-equi TaxID=585013 RepID=A0ABR3EKX1_9AGAR